jgi:hypothetical protein
LKITTKQLTLEKQLNRRLRVIGLILLVAAAIAVIWNFLPFEENELDELVLQLEEAPPPLNPYLAPATFAIVGISCLLIHWKKKNTLSSETPSDP